MNPLFLTNPAPAPEWSASQWLNVARGPTLAELRGKVVVLHAFQMLCPGCVLHGVPQAGRLYQFFAAEEVAVIGIHTVFENHAAMTADALRVFLHEFRVEFPVAVDEASEDSLIPRTMQRYRMRGTPSLLLIDGSGNLRAHRAGAIDDLAAGAAIQLLIDENRSNKI